MFTLMAFGNIKPDDYGLGASRTCIIFFVLPFITGCVTIAVSWCERILEYLRALQKQVVFPTDAGMQAMIPTDPELQEKSSI